MGSDGRKCRWSATHIEFTSKEDELRSSSMAFEFSSRDWESFWLSHFRTVWTVVMLGTELASEKIGSRRYSVRNNGQSSKSEYRFST